MNKRTIVATFLLLLGMNMFAQKVQVINSHTAQVEVEGGTMYLDFYGENIFRLFQDPKGGILRAPVSDPHAEILADSPRRNVKRILTNGSAITTERLLIQFSKEGYLTVGDLKTGKQVLRQTAPIEFTSKTVNMRFYQPEEANFYGGGCQNGRFSHKGRNIWILNTNSWVDGGVASPAPFFWSTAGYALMPYTFTPGVYDFGATEAHTTEVSHETDYLDIFVMINDSAVKLLNDYYQLTGNPVLLPKFAFYEGHLNAYNRDYWTKAEGETGFMKYEDGGTYNESQKDNGGIKESLNGEKQNYQFSARAAVDRYLDNDMPLGWFLPNDGYGAGYGQTETLEGNVENLKQFGDYARSRGVEVGLWTQSDLHPKEDVEALLQRDIVREVRDAGVRVLKTDVAWVGAGYSFGLNGVADVAQVMPYYGNDARPFIITLDGWAGTQRYAGIWTGDQTGGEWEYIRFHIPTYIGCGLSGQPNVSSDMDGIFGGKNVSVNVRDFQWKTFTPMQLNMDGWGRNPKYPQALGEPATSINRWYLKKKSQLMPYTYSIAHEAVNGKPIIRAMMLEEENDYTLGTATQYQFMYGPFMLVAPIYKSTRPTPYMEAGKAIPEAFNDVRDGIYLPKGNWYDAVNGQRYEGGRIINDFDAPLWKIPYFIKGGAIIPYTSAHNTPSEVVTDARFYQVYPEGESEFTEYDDDGVTQAYLKGEYATTHITSKQKGDQVELTVEPTQGSFDGMVHHKYTFFAVRTLKAPKSVVVTMGKKKMVLRPSATVADYQAATGGAYIFLDKYNANEFATEGSEFAKQYIERGAYLLIQVPATDITQNEVSVKISGWDNDQPVDPFLMKQGKLKGKLTPSVEPQAYQATLSWEPMEQADYYEIEYDGQRYSTIRQNSYTLENLWPLTTFSYKVRAVNAAGESEWASGTFETTDDPLRDAIQGMKGECTTMAQAGQSVSHLFDFDETTVWHTDWNETAVPFDLTVDMRSVNLLEKLQYVPRQDAGNGTILEGSVEISMDRKTWTPMGDFSWERNGDPKVMILNVEGKTARYVRLHVTKALGNFGSGQQLYLFRQPGTDYYVPGDINQDGRLDENDLTSYYNYTGLRAGDSDYEGYISKGDLNQNGLIDAYDISSVAIELESGVSSRKVPSVEGKVTVKADNTQLNAGDEVVLTVTGEALKSVNALSFALPYDASALEYIGIEAPGLPQMFNMTYDRLHKNGQKALYPTFVNLGEQEYAEGDKVLMIIRFKALKKSKLDLNVLDGVLVDKYMNTVQF